MDTCHILGIAAWPPAYLEIGWWKYWNRDWNWDDDGKEPVSHYNYPRHGLWHDRHDPQVEVQDLFILIPSYWPTPEYHLLTTSPDSSRTVTLTWRSVALDTCVTLFTTQPGMPVSGTWPLLPNLPRKETRVNTPLPHLLMLQKVSLSAVYPEKIQTALLQLCNPTWACRPTPKFLPLLYYTFLERSVFTSAIHFRRWLLLVNLSLLSNMFDKHTMACESL